MPEWNSILRVYHIFFIHSSVDRHLGCLHVLAIVRSAALNIRVHASFQIKVFIFSRYMSRMGLLDHIVTLYLVFKDPPYYSS